MHALASDKHPTTERTYVLVAGAYIQSYSNKGVALVGVRTSVRMCVCQTRRRMCIAGRQAS